MKYLSALGLMLMIFAADAATYCVGPSATGSGSGSDWNNLKAWSDSPARGDTWYLVDGSYAGKTFSTAVSGTTLITINKATIASHGGISTGWSDALGDGEASFSGTFTFTSSYWVVDGQTGGGPSGWTTGHGFAINHTGTVGAGIDFRASSITASHIKLTGNNGSDDVNSDTFSWDQTAGNDITVSYCFTTNSGRCVIFCARGASNVVFEYNYFGNITGYGSVHGETASIWGDPVNWTFRHNIITGVDSTGGIMWDNHSTTNGYFRIYGNVFYDAGSAWGYHGNGLIGGWTGAGGEQCHNMKVYNNTFVTISSGTPCLGSFMNIYSGLEAKNNLYYSVGDVGNGGKWTADYNHFISTTTNGSNTSTSAGDPFTSIAGLDFRLTTNTTSGTDLGSPYNTDMLGNTRTTWTRGAIEYQTASPSGLSITINTLNTGSLIVR